jgi:hypothetical protein
MRKVAVSLSFIALASFAGTVSAHPGHQHKALGTVVAVDASHVEIKTKDGKTVSVLLNAETKYLKGKAVAAATDVKVGQRVAVTYVEKDERHVATEVQLGVTDVPADSKAHSTTDLGPCDAVPS